MAEQRERDLNKVVTRSCLIEQRTEKHKQKDETGRYTQRNTEHTLGGNPLMVYHLFQICPFMSNNLGHVGTGKGVDQKDRSHNHQGWP